MIDSVLLIGVNGRQVQLNLDDIVYPITSFDIQYDARGEDEDKAQEHGTWYTPDYIGNAHVTIEGDILGNNASDYWLKRRVFMGPFSPIPSRGALTTIQAVYQFSGFGEQVLSDCNLDGQMPDIPMNTEMWSGSHFQVNLKMRDPRFYSAVANQVTIPPPSGGGSVNFPVTFPVHFGGGGGNSVNAYNAGNTFTSPTAVISGPCSNPGLSVSRPDGTLDFWGLQNVFIPAGSTVVADFRNRTVVMNNQSSLYRYKTVSSRWWQLWDGNNTVTFTCVNFDPNQCSCIFQWQNAYFI